MTDILITDFILVFLIFVRITAVIVSAPIFNNASIPTLVKIFLSLLIAYMVFITMNKSIVHVETTFYFLTVSALKEVITGLIIGFALNLVFHAISFAGMLIGWDMGLAMATVFNPMEEEQSNVVGELFYIFTLLIFILINGHHYIIQAAASSFDIIPLGKFTVTGPVYKLLINYSAGVFAIAVKIASPIMVSFFLIHLAEGIISRVIPQMQVFFVTQPLKIALGFVILILVLPVYTYFLKNLLSSYEQNLFDIIKAMGK